jgi:hypothetical protein
LEINVNYALYISIYVCACEYKYTRWTRNEEYGYYVNLLLVVNSLIIIINHIPSLVLLLLLIS